MSQLYYEDVTVDDELPPVEKLPTDELATDFFTRVGEGKPTPERIPVPREGFSGIIVPGMLKVAWIGQFVSDWAGPGAHVRSVRVSYKRPDTTGAPLTLVGRVVDKRDDPSGKLVEIEAAILAEGQPSVMSSVQVIMPEKGAT